jgi:hypothetical protein
MTPNEPTDDFDQTTPEADDSPPYPQAEEARANGAVSATPTEDTKPDRLRDVLARESERQRQKSRDRALLVGELTTLDARRAEVLRTLRVLDGAADDDEELDTVAHDPGDERENPKCYDEQGDADDRKSAKRRARAVKPAAKKPTAEADAPKLLPNTLQGVWAWLSAQKDGGSAKALADHLGFKGDKASVKASGLLGELRKRGLAKHDGQRPATWKAVKA